MKENLLPHSSKKIALGIFLVALAAWLIHKASPGSLDFDPFLIGWILKILILVSLLLNVLSREKIETKRISKLRYDSLLSAVITGGFLVILEFFMEILFQGESSELTGGYGMITFVLIVYSISFYLKKNIKTVVRE